MAKRGPALVPLWDRFWLKVAIPVDEKDSEDCCWIWIGSKFNRRNGGQTGQIREAGRGTPRLRAHRVSLVWSQGPAPLDRPEAGHICPGGSNSLCVNPRHLTWQSREENERWKHAHRQR